MTRRRKAWVAVGVGLLLLGLVAAGFARWKRNGQAVKVEVEPIRERPLVSVVTASGEIQPVKSVDVHANVTGKVDSVAVKEGQTVKEGAFLLQIDPVSAEAAAEAEEARVRSAEADVAEAEAALEQARRDLDRASQLARGDLISKEELQRAESAEAQARARRAAAGARVNEAQAQGRSSRHQLENVTVTAPASGVVTRLEVEKGEIAFSELNPTLLLTIADLSTMEADIEVDETDVVRVKLGQTAKVTVDAFPDTSFAGRVTEVGTSPITKEGAAEGTSADEEVKDFKVVITLDDPLPAPRAGLSATADIETARRETAVAVPIQSLVVRELPSPRIGEAPPDTLGPGQEIEGAFVVRHGLARFAPVHVGIAGDRFFEVRSGLAPGDTVVSGSYEALRDLQDGDRVKVTKPEEKGRGRGRAAASGDRES